jgi:transketolase
MAAEALSAHQKLNKEGVSTRVIHMGTIKPIDEQVIIQAAKETKGIVTIEEHSIIGGLGEAVAGVVTSYHPCPVQRVGIQDVFGESGHAQELLDKFGLRAKNIIEAARKIIN